MVSLRTVRVPRAHTSIYEGWLPSNINESRNYHGDGRRSPDVDVQA